jgi:DnaJ-class molecular chaperone
MHVATYPLAPEMSPMGKLTKIICQACEGTGKIHGKTCPRCKGHGQTVYEEMSKDAAEQWRKGS